MEQLRAELIKYVQLLIRRRYLFTAVSLIIMSGIVWGSYFIAKHYEAKSTIFIERNVIEQLVKGIAITPSMQARIAVLRETMLSRSLMLNVLRKLDLDSQAKNDAELELMILSFQKNTRIKVGRNKLIDIAFKHKNPALAMNFINSLVSVYIENNIFAKREEAYDATKFLDKQVEFFKEKMGRGEEAIIKFRQEQGIYIAMDERSIIKDIRTNRGEIEKIDLRIKELDATKKSISEQLKGEHPFAVTIFSKKGADETIKALENKLKQLLISYTNNYPEVIQVRAEIEALKQQQIINPTELDSEMRDSEISTVNPVYQDLKQTIMAIDTEISALHAKKKHLNGLIANKEEELKNIPESRKQLADLQKDKDSFKKVYERLLERLGQSEVSKQMEIEDKATTFRIIEPAILPTTPVSPNRKMLILAGILLGLFGGFAVVFLRENYDDSVKSVEDIKKFGLPLLAVIPEIQQPEDLMRIKRKDMLVYSITSAYMLCILGVLVVEYLNLPYIEKIISHLFMNNTL